MPLSKDAIETMVESALLKAGLTRGQAPELHYLISGSLIRYQHVLPSAGARLKSIEDTWALAHAFCTPYFPSARDISQDFYCMAAMPSLTLTTPHTIGEVPFFLENVRPREHPLEHPWILSLCADRIFSDRGDWKKMHDQPQEVRMMVELLAVMAIRPLPEAQIARALADSSHVPSTPQDAQGGKVTPLFGAKAAPAAPKAHDYDMIRLRWLRARLTGRESALAQEFHRRMSELDERLHPGAEAVAGAGEKVVTLKPKV
ncbi:MAG: hypothetical protein H6865_00060 [Rhodospirillales bacterium]|nr:hypothetical protein [Alphaproteobacteria bacterium]MCB9986019.1 hypothetical protein [Rhodospirillales bacterium]USO07407.1 MAG: hypothetical protein H6866_08310 [Rhodospirillales bacterium]